ncbi:hypothetical protein [Aquimarina agarilytica]|uniref:hypothetical protein n=1 Tax=Aquimarina agarilytica TaxID=1087449 RepID=UPI0002887BA5|nr:hypothetical protein [Aquimarina agarilytica]
MLDIKKLKSINPKLQKQVIIDEISNTYIAFLEFAGNDVSSYSLNNTKTGITANISSRTLTRWLQQEVVIIDGIDKGKNKRFNRLENIWIKIAIELRKFGVPLEGLKYIRTQLFDYTVGEFSMFKFQVLHNILLEKPKYLIISDEHEVGFYTYKNYASNVEKGFLFSHINIRFIDFIKEEFPNNNIHIDFGITNIIYDVEKVSLLFYLKTNDFQEMHITLSDEDTRLLYNSSELMKNDNLLSAIQKWEFDSIKIQINDETEFIIEN